MPPTPHSLNTGLGIFWSMAIGYGAVIETRFCVTRECMMDIPTLFSVIGTAGLPYFQLIERIFEWTTICKRRSPGSRQKKVSGGGPEGIRGGYTKASGQTSKTYRPRRRLCRRNNDGFRHVNFV